MTHFGGLAQEGWPLPPRGISIGRTNHRAGVLIQYTYLCEASNECLAVAYSQDSELHARQQVSGHKCPQTDGSRGLIATGKTLVQKMWDEADDAMDAYHAKREFKGMSSEHSLQGYIRGIAEVLTFCTVPCFKVTDDVLREINRRWKMRDGQIPFAPTPSYSYHPYLDDARSHSIAKQIADKPAAKPRASLKQVAQAAKPADVELTAASRKTIRDTYHSGVGSKPELAIMLAGMFSISVDRVMSIAGDAPVKTDTVITTNALF